MASAATTGAPVVTLARDRLVTARRRWDGWVAAHGTLLRRLAVARAVALWLGLAYLVVLYVAFPEVRPAVRVWLQCYWLLIAWFLLARTTTLPWRAYAAMFAVAVPWGIVVAALTGGDGLGARTAVAAFGEEALKLVPVAVVALVAANRVRRFAATDWLLIGVAAGLGFQALEDLVRRVVGTYLGGAYGQLALLFGTDGPGIDSGYPQYGWSPLAGGSSVWGEAGYAGHHVFTGLVTAGIGLGIVAWRRGGRTGSTSWRVAGVALPVVLFWTVVVDHLAFNASQDGTGWVDDGSVPAVIGLWWRATGSGYGRAWLLLALLAVAMVADARRLRRATDVLAGLPFAPQAVARAAAAHLPTGAADVVTRSLRTAARNVVTLAAFTARDVAFVATAFTRDDGETVRAALARGRRAATIARLARLEAYGEEAGSARGTRRAAVAGLLAVAVVGLAVAPAVAATIDSPYTAAWLAGLLERLGDWWQAKSAAEQIVFVAGLMGLVVLSGGSFGAALGTASAAGWALDHAHGAAAFSRDPGRAVRGYLATTTPAGAALDLATAGLAFAPGGLARGTAARGIRGALDEGGDAAAWVAGRRDLVEEAQRQRLEVKDFGALRYYTGRGYGEMNHALRRPAVPLTPDVRRRVAALDAALEKVPVHDGWVHRGTTLNDDQLMRYRPGATIRERAFTSTALDPGDRFAGNVHMIVRSRTGRDVSPFSQVPDEREVLFRRDTAFRVIERSYDPVEDEHTIVLMEVLR